VNTPQAQLAPVLAAGGPELARLLEATERQLSEVTAGHGAALDRYAGGTLGAGGKRLRPVLVFLCAGEHALPATDREAAAPAASPDPAETAETRHPLLAAAAAVELLHMASLVHDDVLDRADLRRGQATVVAAGGRGIATAAGDFLFSRAFAVLAATGDAQAVRSLSRAATSLVRGELMQRADAWSSAVGADRYRERCRLKTSSLFEASCRLGALLGGEPQLADGLGRFGAEIGLAFQIFDDVLDVAGPTQRTGKPRGADLLDGTVTLPLIFARARDRDLRALDLRAAVMDGTSAAAVCDRIAATGALEEARSEALEHVAEAKRSLARLELPAQRQRALDLVADGVVERYA
jgi:octaprenyl-diphosphate synthase